MPQDPPPAPAPATPDPVAGRFHDDPAVPGAAHDRLLDRQVAVRRAGEGGAAALAAQARLLARLEHAGVPAVHDLIAGHDGSRLVQRRFEGVTLASAIASAAAGMPPPELATPSTTVQTMLKVCDIIAAAHSRGVVHRHLSPDAIMLGSHGQVLIPDWDGAQASEPPTPRPDGLHQDLRAVAACLSAALLRRLPGPDGGGALLVDPDPQLMPADLAGILQRAVRSDAADGYRGMPELAQDLGRWLEGQAPATAPAGVVSRAYRRVRRPGGGLALAAVVVAILAVVAGIWYGRQMLALPRWGEPVISENFADPSWKNRWAELPSSHGMFTVKDGRLVSTAARSATIFLKQRLTTPVAIEYTGEMLPGSEPCDLSVTWNEGALVGIEDPDLKPKAMRSLGVQSGGYGNTAFLMLLSGNRFPVAYKAEKLVNGRRYHFRVEIEDASVSLYVDGRLTLHHQDLFPFVSGHLGLYGHYPGKAFSDVRIWQKAPPSGITPLAVGDHYLLQNAGAQALPYYDQVLQAHGDSEIGQQARFREGLALWQLDRRDEALDLWKPIVIPALRERAGAYALLGGKDEWMRDGFAEDFARRYREDAGQRAMLRQGWMHILGRLATGPFPDPHLEDRILALRESLFPEDDRAAYAASSLLVAHTRFTDAMQRFPGNQPLVGSCMLALGRSGEVLAQPVIDVDVRVKAWQMRGEFAKVIDAPSVNPVLSALARCKLGRGEELLNDPDLRYPVLLHLGRAEDLLAADGLAPLAVNEALISLGRWAEAAGPGIAGRPGSGGSMIARLLQGDAAAIERESPAIRWMQAAEAGDRKVMERLQPQVAMPRDLRYHSGWFTAAIALPVAQRLLGDAQALEQLRPQLDLFAGIYGKRPWYLARAVLGETPVEAVMEMPAVTEREAWQALARGMCAELAGDAATARSAYQEFTTLPLSKRLLILNTPDPEVEWFVRWRLRAIGG